MTCHLCHDDSTINIFQGIIIIIIAHFAEPVLHQLLQSFCKPILVYNAAGAVSSKSVINKIQYHWNCVICKLYDVSSVNLNVVLAYMGFLPICLDVLLVKLSFF